MSEADKSEDFEIEARERLARIETKQEHQESMLEDLADGQQAISNQLAEVDDHIIDDDRVDEIERDVDLNTQARRRYRSILLALGSLLSLGSGFTGVVLFIL
jgi:hypothetical protein